MNELSIQKFNQLIGQLALGYNVTEQQVVHGFSIIPSISQQLQDKIVEQSSFLQKINILGVEELTGSVILGGVKGPVSGRTDTSVPGKERRPRNMLGLDENTYLLCKTNSDVSLPYDLIDAWAKFPDFADRYTRYVQEQIANDREIVGWYGESAEKDTDIESNPLLQDVNIGWMQIMRSRKAANILTSGAITGEVRLGEGGDYVNLDDAVSDLLQGIPKYKRAGLIALVGDELVSKEHAGLYKAIGSTPSEKVLAQSSMSLMGGLSWDTPSNFPGRGLVITSLNNLSIYYQNGKWRRKVKDVPERDQVEDYNSRNEGYVVEDLEKFVALEFKNVKLKNKDGEWA